MLHNKEVVRLDFGQHAEQDGFLYELGSLLGWRSGTLVWMLYGFFDESGEHDAADRLIRLTIGGGLATFDTWQALTKDWVTVLANHGIETFHSANDKNNDLLMQDIYRVIDKYPMWMFGTTHIGQHKDNLFKEAYGKGVIELLKMVHRQADTERDEFQLVFAEHRDFRIGRIARYCEKMKLLLPKLNGWSSSRPQTCLPLQLSDLVAHAVKCSATGDHRQVERLRHKHSFQIFTSQP